MEKDQSLDENQVKKTSGELEGTNSKIQLQLQLQKETEQLQLLLQAKREQLAAFQNTPSQASWKSDFFPTVSCDDSEPRVKSNFKGKTLDIGEASYGQLPPPPAPIQPIVWPTRLPATPQRQERLFAAQQLIEQAKLLGNSMTLAEAIHIINEEKRDNQTMTTSSPAPRYARAQAERLLYIEKSLPIFNGSTLVSDFLHKIEYKMAQQNITDPLEKHTLMVSKLEGKAFTAVRSNPTICTDYISTTQFLKETYGPTITGIKAQLLTISYKPKEESLREYNERFNTIAASAPSGSMLPADLMQYYIKALGRGDSNLTNAIIWGIELNQLTITQLQKIVINRLDNYQIYSNDAVTITNPVAPMSFTPILPDKKVMTPSIASSTANTEITQILKDVQELKSVQQKANSASIKAVTSPNYSTKWQESRTCHLCKKQGHISPNCPEKKNNMLSKAVGLVIDHCAAQAAAYQDEQKWIQEYEQSPIHACNMPDYALGYKIAEQAKDTLSAWQGQSDPIKKGSLVTGFAQALARFCFSHPNNERAVYYLRRVEDMGEKALDQMIQDGEISLANKILADKKRSIGTQAGERGVAVDLWPGVTEVLSTLPAKTNLFEWLKESEPFCTSLVELIMEIAMDNGWNLDYSRMYQEITVDRGSRSFGKYAADKRAQLRQHGAEAGRIMSGKAGAQASLQSQPDQRRPSKWDQMPEQSQENEVNMLIQAHAMRTGQGKVPITMTGYSFDAARAALELGFGDHVEDMTSLAGPPTPHQIIQVVIFYNGRSVKITAIRDSGSPDTIITEAYLKNLNMGNLGETDKKYTGIGAASSTRFLGLTQPIKLRLTPKISVTHQFFVSPDKYCLLILGNDIFNKEVVETLSLSDDAGCYVLRQGDILDIMPFKQLTIKERKDRERAYEEAQQAFSQPSESDKKDKLTAYDQFVRSKVQFEPTQELLIASQAAQTAINQEQHPPVPPRFHAINTQRNVQRQDQNQELREAKELAINFAQQAINEEDPPPVPFRLHSMLHTYPSSFDIGRRENVQTVFIWTGPMFAGKTTALIADVNSRREEGQQVITVKHSSDTRNHATVIATHSKKAIIADYCVNNLSELPYPRKAIMAIEELHFYPDAIEQMYLWQEQGIKIVATTISTGLRGEPFYLFKEMDQRGIKYNTNELTANCDKCNNKANYTARITPLDVYVGGKESYAATCESCFQEINVLINPKRLLEDPYYYSFNKSELLWITNLTEQEWCVAVNAAIVALSHGNKLEDILCPYCEEQHIDTMEKAMQSHSQHECIKCKRKFNLDQPSVGSPLVRLVVQLTVNDNKNYLDIRIRNEYDLPNPRPRYLVAEMRGIKKFKDIDDMPFLG